MSEVYEPKADVYQILLAVGNANNATVYLDRPEVLNELPSIVFSVPSNVPTYALNREIAFQDVDIAVDIFAEESTDVTTLLKAIETAMIVESFRLSFAGDVGEPDSDIQHMTTRFNLVT